MIYVYDILLNFSDNNLYEFFEWNKNDVVDNIKKIKLIKVDNNTFDDFIDYKIEVDKFFLEDIYKSCELYLDNGYELLDYCVLISDGNRVIASEFDKSGYLQCRSKLLLDEEEEVLSIINNLDLYHINYKKTTKKNYNKELTRKEIKIKKYLLNEVNIAKKNNDISKLRYMYMELFENENYRDSSITNDILNSLNKSINLEHVNLYNLLKLSDKKKQV